MAFKRRVKLPGVQSLDGETATQTNPLGARYHAIQQTISDTAGEHADVIVNECRVLVNGVAQRTFGLDELDHLNGLHGAEFQKQAAGTAAVGNPGYAEIITILFAQLYRKEVIYQEMSAWGTGGLSSFTLEYDLAGKAGTNIVNIARVDQSLIQNGSATVQQPLGLIEKWYRSPVNITGVEKQIIDIPLNRGDLIGLSFFDANIASIQIKLNEVIVYDMTKQQNDADLVAHGMFPTADVFDVVFDADDILTNILPLTQFNGLPVSSLEVNLTLSDGTPRNINLIRQVWGRPD